MTKKIFFISFYFLLANISFSQQVEIIKGSDLKKLPEGKKFAFIEPTTDTSKAEFIATILAKDKNKKSVIENLYFDIRKEANKLGANCFRIKSFIRDTLKNEAVLILDCYLASDSLIKINFANHEKNVVYVFGEEKENDGITYSFNVNGTPKVIKPGTYFKQILKEDEELKLSKGGVLGMTVWLNGKKDKQPDFFTLSTFGVSNVTTQPAVGISFNSGRINRIDNTSLGLLMTQLLKPGN